MSDLYMHMSRVFADFGMFDFPEGLGGTVTVDKGMQILEEMDREEAAKYEENGTSGAHNASS